MTGLLGWTYSPTQQIPVAEHEVEMIKVFSLISQSEAINIKCKQGLKSGTFT